MRTYSREMIIIDTTKSIPTTGLNSIIMCGIDETNVSEVTN